MIVIAALPTIANDVERPLQQLDLRLLGHTDPHLDFALPTDFDEAPQKHVPGDHALVDKAEAGIQDLNSRYGEESRETFLFLSPRMEAGSRRGLLDGAGDYTEQSDGVQSLAARKHRRILFSSSQKTRYPPRHRIRHEATDASLPEDRAPCIVGALAGPVKERHAAR